MSRPMYFMDLKVIKTVTRKEMTISEVMDLLDRQPNVKTVSIKCDPPRRFSIETLAYPQYRDRYTLTKKEWKDLQKRCREGLKEGVATKEVLEHWVSIVSGKPPFGLIVNDSNK